MHIRAAYSVEVQPPADTFTPRLQVILDKLRGWYFWLYGTEHLDDALQEASFKLWRTYQKRQEELDSATDSLWFTIGKWAACNARTTLRNQDYTRPGTRFSQRTPIRRVFTASDLAAQYGDGTMDGHEYLEERLAVHDDETAEVDARIEVERILSQVLPQMGPLRRGQVTVLIEGLMRGETLSEIRREQGWSESTAGEIMRVMPHACNMAATGQAYDPAHNKARMKAGAEEIALARKLRDQGLSLNQVGARLGRSKAWAQHILRWTCRQ